MYKLYTVSNTLPATVPVVGFVVVNVDVPAVASVVVPCRSEYYVVTTKNVTKHMN
jgi:hypothetical protein